MTRRIPPGTPYVVGPAMGKASIMGISTGFYQPLITIEFNHPVIVGKHVYHCRTRKAAREFAILMGGRC